MTMPKMTSPRKLVQKASRVPSRTVHRESEPTDRATALHPILHLQQVVGNQAVGRLIQARLKVGQPGDKHEQEADRVADAVMRMPEPQVQRQVEEEEEEEQLQTKSLADQITPLVQRQAEGEEEEEEEQLQTKPLADQITPLVQRQAGGEEEEEEERIQAKGDTGRTPEVTPDLKARLNAIRGGSRPLPQSDRAFFEPRFGYDFSQVRIHTDARAAEAARTLNARAFTIGQDVVFGAGQYGPGTPVGKRLLAHELTHVIQQSSCLRSKTTSLPVRRTSNRVLARDTEPVKESKTSSLTTAILQGKQPLKLVLYQRASILEHLRIFRGNAGLIANEINAVKIPTKCPKDRSKLDLQIGAMGFGGSILGHIKRAHNCVRRKISELHIVGHGHQGISFSKRTANAMKKMKEYLSSDVKVFFHGCSVLHWTGLKKLLKILGSEAKVFAHSTIGEAGRAYQFYKVTLPAGESKIRSELVRKVSIIVPEDMKKKAVEILVSERVEKQKTKPLYQRLRARWVPEDVKKRIVEILVSERLEKQKTPQLYQLLRAKWVPEDMKKKTVEILISERVERQKTKPLYKRLRARWVPEDVKGKIVKVLSERLEQDAKRWGYRRIKKQLRKRRYDWERVILENRIKEIQSQSPSR
jgi:hypothetical protein